ncbi:MAG: hypothetical protein JOY96_11510 [Verrucomicrobia bacterium]|nr:hypothetical protein [Verrucomicrobiota bacterium]
MTPRFTTSTLTCWQARYRSMFLALITIETKTTDNIELIAQNSIEVENPSPHEHSRWEKRHPFASRKRCTAGCPLSAYTSAESLHDTGYNGLCGSSGYIAILI